MLVDFLFPEFNIGDKDAVNVTKRIGKFVVNENESDFLQRFKEELNQQQDFEDENIDEKMATLLDHYIQWSNSQKKIYDNHTSMTNKASQLMTALETEVECSLAFKFNKADCFCYSQIRSGSENWEIVFEMNKYTKNVVAFEVYQYFDAKINIYSYILFQSWMSSLPQTTTAHKGNASSLMVGKDEKSNVVLDDDGGGVSGRIEDPLPLVNESEAPVYVSNVHENSLQYQFWQSWAQWVFMFQDHKTVNNVYKEKFMEYFMTLVAKELFHVPGEVVRVKRHKNIPETKDLSRVTTFHTGDHIEAHHVSQDDEGAEGKILVLYKNLPHGESPEDYDRLIRETGLHGDTAFIYIGKGADLEYCDQVISLEEITTRFYRHATTGHSGSRRAAATGEGNAGTENLMVDDDEGEMDPKSIDERWKKASAKIAKDLSEHYKRAGAQSLLQKNWRVHHAKKEAARRRTDKAKKELEEERKREEEQRKREEEENEREADY